MLARMNQQRIGNSRRSATPTTRLERLALAAGMVASSLRAFARFPSLFIALVFVWAATAAVTFLALPYAFDAVDALGGSYVAFAVIGLGGFAVAGVLLSFACFILLERVRQIEMDEPRSVAAALGRALVNTARAIPIILVWSVLWLGVNALAALLGGDEDDDGAASFGDTDSLLDLSMRAACDALRMLVFLSLPAIAWEVGNGPLRAVKRGVAVARRHGAEFAVGLLLTELGAWLAALPLLALLAVTAGSEADVPELVWFGALALALLGWTLVMLVQQLFAAELYVWHLLWEDASERSLAEGTGPLDPHAVPRPSLIDGIPALAAIDS